METDFNFDAVIGVDPGANGGIALYRPGNNVKVIRMPKNIADIREFLQYVKEIAKQPIIFIEKVQLRSDDVNANPGKAFRIQQLLSAFQQLKDYFEIEDIPYIQVHPMTWQSTLKLRKQGEEKTERKNRYKRAAQHYYPIIKATLWNADALLIMHAGRLKLQNDPDWVRQNLPNRVINSLFKK